MHELVPMATTLALLINSTNPVLADTELRNVEAAARTLGVQLHVLSASTEHDFDNIFRTLVQLRAGGLVIGPDPFFNTQQEQLAGLSLRHAVPAIYQYREFVAAGGMMSYGGGLTDAYRIVGTYPVGFSRAKSPPTFRSSKPRKSSLSSA
jgi:putative ABC transport system substrate-binding protein